MEQGRGHTHDFDLEATQRREGDRIERVLVQEQVLCLLHELVVADQRGVVHVRKAVQVATSLTTDQAHTERERERARALRARAHTCDPTSHRHRTP